MSSLNHPDKIVLDAYSDPLLETYNGNGMYSGFTNQFRTPILNAKGVMLLNANIINSMLQLNDASQLMFFYYVGTTASTIRSLANLRCVRLHPSTFVPQSGFTAFTKNRYFNSVVELVGALNLAAATGGDSATYNPLWVANQIVFSYDTNTRKVSVDSTTSGTLIAPASADDPFVLDQLRGTTTPTNRIRMNGANSSGTYATATIQPYVEGYSMNARLGFAMNFTARGLWWGANSVQGCATSTGVPTDAPIEADSNPILIGSQNVNVYLSIITGSGMDSWSQRKNLLATIPLEVAPLNINSYTTNSAEKPALSVPNELYEVRVEFFDDAGVPFLMPPNYNAELVLSVFY